MRKDLDANDAIDTLATVSGSPPMSLQKASIAFTASVSALIGISLLLASV